MKTSIASFIALTGFTGAGKSDLPSVHPTFLAWLIAHYPVLIHFSFVVPLSIRQDPFFIVDSVPLPDEVSAIASSLTSVVTCSSYATTIQGVPDVVSDSIFFSSINFSSYSKSPLAFALSEFATTATAGALADENLGLFQDRLNVYLATEAGIRSIGGSLAIKTPKFFLELQVARIMTAHGNPPKDTANTVEYKLGKVLKLTTAEDPDLVQRLREFCEHTIVKFSGWASRAVVGTVFR